MFTNADVPDALTGVLGARGPEINTPNSYTAVELAVEAEQTCAE